MPASPPRAFVDALDAWTVWLSANRGRGAATVSKYRRYLERLARWCIEPHEDPKRRASTPDPLALTAADLETFAGLHAHAEGLSPRARRPLVSALRGFYTWAASTGRTPGNPSVLLPSPKVGRNLPRAATLHHAEKLLMAPNVDTLPGLRDASIIACLAGLGPRVSGLVSLNEGDLLWSVESGRDVLYITLREKGGNVRQMPAPAEVAMLLRAYIAHPDLQEIDRTTSTGDRVLFVSLRARSIPPHDYHGERRRLSRRAVHDMLQRYAARVGVPPEYAHPHALRHLFGAELAEDDTVAVTHQVLMGHSDANSSAIYAHLAQRKLRAAVEKSSPLRKMRAPLLETLRTLADRAARRP
jgi:integrase/recombinase XerD